MEILRLDTEEREAVIAAALAEDPSATRGQINTKLIEAQLAKNPDMVAELNRRSAQFFEDPDNIPRTCGGVAIHPDVLVESDVAFSSVFGQ